MDSKVTVGIPTYNYAHYLPEAIESVLAQTYANVEIIVLDDASTDNTKEIAVKYPVKYIRHEKNWGLAATRNTGLKVGEGDWFMFLDADDKIDKDLISLSLQYANAKKADIVGVWQKEFGDTDFVHYFHPEPTHQDFIMGNKINCSSMFSRKVYETIGGYDERLTAYEDWQFWLRATKAGFKVVTIPLPLFYYRKHKGSMIDKLIEDGLRDKAFEAMKDTLPDIYYDK